MYIYIKPCYMPFKAVFIYDRIHLYRNRGAMVTYMNRETVNTGCGSTWMTAYRAVVICAWRIKN
jgi:hypothetical protein